MKFNEKLQALRKKRGITQEELSEKLNVSRQAVAKWESGQAVPDLEKLVGLSNVFHVTIDYLAKDEDCAVSMIDGGEDIQGLMDFRLEASRQTYAGCGETVASTRYDSHDYRYERGEYAYHDTYVGGERFAGEETVWRNGRAVYAMNYAGRVLDERFSGDFLKEALREASGDMPYRGRPFINPAIIPIRRR